MFPSIEISREDHCIVLTVRYSMIGPATRIRAGELIWAIIKLLWPDMKEAEG